VRYGALFERLPAEVSVYEVSPRDGLQNEAVTGADARQGAAHRRARRRGLKRTEVTSFVSPKWVPQLADAVELCRLLKHPRG
jgi:hydroxymethylglutaryl-CoA lyase